jgi:hypothetical protein
MPPHKGFSHPWLEVFEWSGRHSTLGLNGGLCHICRQKERTDTLANHQSHSYFVMEGNFNRLN